MEKQIIGRGLLAGAAAGVLAFIFARIFVEPQIELAIGYEDGIAAAHEAMETAAGVAGHSHGEDGGGFTRAVQMNIGMGLGVLLFSLAIGALFAVAFAVTYGRVGNISARLTSLYVAGGMLLSLYVVPALKYPASPPALSLDGTGRLKISPLVTWSLEDSEAFEENNDLIIHPLTRQGYPSIGCATCTLPVAEGEDPRAGRWATWPRQGPPRGRWRSWLRWNAAKAPTRSSSRAPVPPRIIARLGAVPRGKRSAMPPG